jgi:hypothetical protein
MEDEPDVLYFDLISTNFISTTGRIPYAEYNQSRTIPYLKNPSKYYGAVTQFTINNTSVPVLNPEIQINQPDINLTIYTVSLQYNNVSFTVPVIYTPQNLLAPIPLPPTSYADGLPFYLNGYYSIYNYEFFNAMVNTAFSSAWNSLKTVFGSLPNVDAPIISYNPITQLFSIIVDNDVFTDNGSAPYVSIYMNGPLFHLYSFLPSQSTLLEGITAEKLYITNNTGILDSTTNLRNVSQELPSINLWSPADSIVITSAFLPVQNVLIATPQLYFNNQSFIISQITNSLTQPILIEYSVSDNIYTKTINYLPTAQLQFFDLLDSQPLYNIDFKFYYRTKSGTLYPLYLNSGASCSVKLGFFKKDKFSHLKSIK